MRVYLAGDHGRTAIFSTLAAAVLSASQYVVKQSVRVEQRMIAAWLADNQLNELRLQNAVAAGHSQRVASMNGRQWWLQQRISSTDDLRLWRVDIDVGLSGREVPEHQARGWLPTRHE